MGGFQPDLFQKGNYERKPCKDFNQILSKKGILKVLPFSAPSSCSCICCLWTGTLFIGLTEGQMTWWIGLSVTGQRPCSQGFLCRHANALHQHFLACSSFTEQGCPNSYRDIQDDIHFYLGRINVPIFRSNPSHISWSHSKMWRSNVMVGQQLASIWQTNFAGEAKISSKYIWWHISWILVPKFNS